MSVTRSMPQGAGGLPRPRWSVLRMLSAMRRSNTRGQIAVMSIVFIALALMLATVTMNLGEVARLKTATANAADAGALAGASWVASVENEMATISAACWVCWNIIQILWAFPYCWTAVISMWPLQACLALVLTLAFFYIQMGMMIAQVWDNAKKAAFFTALQNVGIDDPTGEVQKRQIEPIRNSTPRDVTFRWKRKGGDGAERESWVRIQTDFPSMPPVPVMVGLPMLYWFFTPMVPPFCEPVAPSWIAGYTIPAPIAGNLSIPILGACTFCGAAVVPVGCVAILPAAIVNGNRTIEVKVTQHRAPGAQVGFWRMRYPDQIVSTARAKYTWTNIAGMIPIRDARAFLVSAR